MSLHPKVSLVAVLVASLAFGWCGLLGPRADSAVAAAWPFGAITGCALLLHLRWRVVVVVLLAATVLGSTLLGGAGVGQAATQALAHVLAVVVTLVVLLAGREAATLLSERDITRYVVASLAGGLAGIGVVLARILLVGLPVTRSDFGLGLQHCASAVLLLPFFMPQNPHRATAPVWERAVQWVATGVLLGAVFGSPQPPSAAFLVLASLSWGARRLGTWEALGQAAIVVAGATALTLVGRGPFALRTPTTPATIGVADNLLLEAFAVCVAVVSVPLILTVGVQLSSVRVASRERDRITSIVDGARGLSIIGIDPDGEINLFNVGAQHLLGYGAEEMTGRNITTLLPADELAVHACALGTDCELTAVALAMAAVPSGRRQVRMIRRDGQVRMHSGAMHTIRGPRDELVGFVCISEDVSARVRERESLELAVRRLREADEAKDTFVSSVSHELRTPLASMLGYVEMMGEGDFGVITDAQRDILARVEANGARLLDLIDDLLTFARLGEEQLMAQDPVELRQVLRTTMEVVEPSLRTRDLEIGFDVPAADIVISGDRRMLERLLLNIVANAIKFTPDGGRIEINLVVHESEAALTVVDTGIGIPADEMPRLSSRFFRSRRAYQQAIAGTGLGLSIARSVAEAHGGGIEIASVEGEGTSVRIRLPTS